LKFFISILCEICNQDVGVALIEALVR